ncbi:alpha/beta hydrolase [Cytophagaceae bacterium DM2B3-1]|uniref:Alpha/beta hydrolase n=1 Tax=Xanthocytophaga flava TaxID=3048013 RepID=A0ABT7CY15_9BACT|nr:alpha/beta hydrolase [Xanthocytophaga flavus]MDJ1498659.1 alpha/beta hydrolase [Xanthocytophaga flavus]
MIDSEVEELFDALKKYRSREGFLNDIDQTINTPGHIVWGQIQCPVLILHSQYDRSVPLDHALYAKRHIPHALLPVVKNKWGHLIWLGTDFEQTSSILNAFIKE